MDDTYVKRWQALRKEYDAKAKRLEAAQRLQYNDMFDDLGAEFQAASHWSEAAWKEFVAKLERRWHELESSS